MGLWALVAKQETLVFPGTADALPIEACALMYCNPAQASLKGVHSLGYTNAPVRGGRQGPDDGAVVACTEEWTAPVVFDELQLTANMQDPPGVVLSMLSGDKVRDEMVGGDVPVRLSVFFLSLPLVTPVSSLSGSAVAAVSQ